MRGFSQQLSTQVSKSAGAAGNESGKRFSSGMMAHVKGIATALASAFVVTKGVQFFKDSIREASDLSESINAVSVTFGKAAKGVLTLSENAAQAMGLSRTEFNALAVRFSNFATTIAGRGGDVVGTLQELTGRAADFASVMNLDVNEAAELFQSGLAGETEPLRRYGLDLSAARVQAYALANGITDNAAAMTESQKVQARYRLLMEQTAKTAGDFANTSDGLANRQRIANAQWKNAQATIGTALLPVMEAVTGFIQTQVVPAFQRFGEWFQRDGMPALSRFGATLRDDVLPVLSGLVGFLIRNRDILIPLATIIAGIVAAYKVYAMVTGLVTIAQIALNVAMTANPIGLIVVAIGALIAAIVVLWNKNETFRKVVIAAWEAIKAAAEFVWNGIRAVIETVWNAIKRAVDVVWPYVEKIIKGVWTAIKWYVTTYIDVVQKVITVAWKVIEKATHLAWEAIKTFIINPIRAANDVVRAVIAAVRDWLSSTWATIRDRASAAWQNIKDAVTTPVDAARTTVRTIVGNVRDWLSDAWTAIRERAASAWTAVKGAILDPLRSLWDTFKDILGIGKDGGIREGEGALGRLVSAFGAVVKAVKAVFGGIKDAVVGPIADAFRWVNDNVITRLNDSILSKFGDLRIPYLPVPKGYATGGWVDGPGTGTSDSILARLSKGEFVVNARAAAANATTLERLNEGEQPITGANIQSLVSAWKAPAGWIGKLMSKGAGAAVRALTGPAMGWLSERFSGTIGGNLALGGLQTLFESLSKWGDKQQVAPTPLMEALFRWMKGIEGDHGYYNRCLATVHRALDALAGRFGYTTGALISTSPDPNYIIDRLGRSAFNTTKPPRGALAFWYFPGANGHIAVATGLDSFSINNWGGDTIETVANIGSSGYVGWLPPTRFISGGEYDSGGYLAPGWSLAFNGTGRPEPVLTAEQWDSMGQAGVTNHWNVYAHEQPSEDAMMAAWRRWEAMAGL
jgi:hypothetical protein